LIKKEELKKNGAPGEGLSTGFSALLQKFKKVFKIYSITAYKSVDVLRFIGNTMFWLSFAKRLNT